MVTTIDPSRLVAFDLETTGLDASTDRIITAALIGVDGVRLDLKMNPGIPIPAEATAIHGISDADVANAVPYHQGISVLSEALAATWAAGSVIVGHNILRYDLPFYKGQEKKVFGGYRVRLGASFDTLTTFRRMFPGKVARLDQACSHVGIPPFDAHNAVADAGASLRLAMALLQLGDCQPVIPG